MFNTLWDTPSVSDADVWADYGDYAEAMWSDAEDEWDEADAEAYWEGQAEDAAMEAHLFGWDA
jgi:hypothetical protein